ncbi:MAG TPA: response regulator [Candidatus Obscuribacterales bacterium]
MTNWDESIRQARQQINDLKDALDQNRLVKESHHQYINEARSKVEQLLDHPSTPREALYQLPLVLESLSHNKVLGSMLIGGDGQVMVHNFTTSRLLPIDVATGKFSAGSTYFDIDTGKQLTEEDLPWNLCLKGAETPPSVRIKMRHRDVEGDVHFEIGTVALRTGEGVNGVVVLFVDATEPVKIDEYIKKLCQTLDKQVGVIENAHKQLTNLAEKLGVEPWGNAPEPEALRPAPFSSPSASPSPSASAAPSPSPSASAAPSPAAPAPAIKPTTTTTNDNNNNNDNKILLVDDIPANHRLLTIQLKSFGLQLAFDTANNGLEAVSMCQKRSYSLVFMDCDMPIMDGYEATKQIRKNEKATGAHTPIVAMTSYDRVGDREMCLASGMDDYAFKGISKENLRAILDRYVFKKETVTIAPAVHAPTAQSQAAVANDSFDIQSLQKRFGHEAADVVSQFFSSVSTLLNCLEFAIEEKDAKGVNHFAYSLKGPCSTLGLKHLSNLAVTITSAAENGRWEQSSAEYSNLRAAFQKLKSEAGALALPGF